MRQRQTGLWLLREHLDMRGHFLCLFVMLSLAGHAPGSRKVLRFQGLRLLFPGAGVFAAGLAAVTLTIGCGVCMRSLPATWQRTFPALVEKPVSLTEPWLVTQDLPYCNRVHLKCLFCPQRPLCRELPLTLFHLRGRGPALRVTGDRKSVV